MSIDHVRETVARQLRGSGAHAGLAAAIDGFPPDHAGRRADGHRHTGWQLVEHLRLAAVDLVAYCTTSDYTALDWPAGYWPESPEPPSKAAWSASARGVLDATEEMAKLVEDRARDLFAPVPAAEKPQHHTLRAALILLDHNGYHAGQLIMLRQALGVWPAS